MVGKERRKKEKIIRERVRITGTERERLLAHKYILKKQSGRQKENRRSRVRQDNRGRGKKRQRERERK